MRRLTLVIGVLMAASLGCGGGNNPGSGPDSNKSEPNSAPARAITSGGKVFTSTSYGFTAFFPWGAPSEAPFLIGNILPGLDDSAYFSTRLREGDKQSSRFGIFAIRYKPRSSAEEREEVFRAAMGEVYIPKEMKKSKPQDVIWSKQKAKEFSAEVSESSGVTKRVTVRSFTTESTAYIGVAYDLGQLTPKEISVFFDSFQLQPSQVNSPTGSSPKSR
jgi:hypothetical protein